MIYSHLVTFETTLEFVNIDVDEAPMKEVMRLLTNVFKPFSFTNVCTPERDFDTHFDSFVF